MKKRKGTGSARSPEGKMLEAAAAKHPGRTGRPSKLTPEIQGRICQAIAAGNYMETAAAYCLVDKPTLYAWMKKGNTQRHGKYRDFLNAMDEALAKAEIRGVTTIAAAGAKQWQAAAWLLERTRPKRFGRKLLELTGANGGPIQTEERGTALLDTLRRLAGDEPAPGTPGATPAAPAAGLAATLAGLAARDADEPEGGG